MWNLGGQQGLYYRRRLHSYPPDPQRPRDTPRQHLHAPCPVLLVDAHRETEISRTKKRMYFQFGVLSFVVSSAKPDEMTTRQPKAPL